MIIIKLKYQIKVNLLITVSHIPKIATHNKITIILILSILLYLHKDNLRDNFIDVLMSLEDTVINDIDISLATIENPFTTINTEAINIDGLTIFRENDDLYKKDEKTGNISKLASEGGGHQIYKWYKIRERDDLVYLDGDLVVDNVVYLNGNIMCNYDISDFSSNIEK